MSSGEGRHSMPKEAPWRVNSSRQGCQPQGRTSPRPGLSVLALPHAAHYAERGVAAQQKPPQAHHYNNLARKGQYAVACTAHVAGHIIGLVWLMPKVGVTWGRPPCHPICAMLQAR